MTDSPEFEREASFEDAQWPATGLAGVAGPPHPPTSQRGSQAVPSMSPTVPSEAYDPTHPDHDGFIRMTRRCLAVDCPTHNPQGDPR